MSLCHGRPSRKETKHRSKSLYHKKKPEPYNRNRRPRSLNVRDLVLKVAGHIQKGVSAAKLAPKWEGSYIVKDVYDNGYFVPLNLTRRSFDSNAKLKLYCP